MDTNSKDNESKSRVTKAIYNVLVENGYKGTFDFAVAVNAPHIPILFYFIDNEISREDQETVLHLVKKTAKLFEYDVYEDGDNGYYLKARAINLN